MYLGNRMWFAAVVSTCQIGLWGQDGAAIWKKSCAICHQASSETRAPLPEALAKLPRQRILASLETGSMKEQGALLSAQDREAVASFLAAAPAKLETSTGLCAAGVEPRADSPSWNGWGVDMANTRFQPATMARLSLAEVPKLKLKWAFGFPNAVAAVAQPVLVAGRLYFGSMDGTVYSADPRTGCVYWTFKADAMVRTAISVGPIRAGRHALMFGDQKAQAYAIDSKDGALIWKTKVDEHPMARLSGAPKLYRSRLYVPVSSHEEVSPASAKYECCTFRGSVVALDAESGKQIWKTHTIPDPPRPTKKNPAGVQMHGPAGAAVWLSPAIDVKRNALYIGTGNAYSDPETGYSDAVIAMDLDTGSVKWVRQLTGGDGWNFSCISPNKANCPASLGEDVDIGASPILKDLPGNRSVLLIGQKSAVVYALDPDQQGRILWQTRIGKGGAMGGIVWGMGADEQRVYVPLSDIRERDNAGGLFAIRIASGERAWYAPPVTPACAGKPGCSKAQLAPPTVIPGVVFSGSMDGTLRAHDATDGAVIWEFNTLRDFETVNGVKARGGSLNATGPVIAGGMMFLNSGYGILGGMAGNVLLAFAAE